MYVRRKRFENRLLRTPLTAYRHRTLRDGDVLLATYPRSGTTWMKFILYELLTGREADFRAVREGVPYIGERDAGADCLPGAGRIVQTHEPYYSGANKVIYVIRDPRAVVVSLYYWLMRRGQVSGSIHEFVPQWVRGRGTPWRSWSDHVEYWLASKANRRDEMHLVRYEDLKESPHDEVAKTLRFLDQDRPDQAIDEAIEHNRLEEMRRKEASAPGMRNAVRPDIPFVRSGSSSGWRDELTAADLALIVDSYRPTMERFGYATGPTV